MAKTVLIFGLESGVWMIRAQLMNSYVCRNLYVYENKVFYKDWIDMYTETGFLVKATFYQ